MSLTRSKRSPADTLRPVATVAAAAAAAVVEAVVEAVAAAKVVLVLVNPNEVVGITYAAI